MIRRLVASVSLVALVSPAHAAPKKKDAKAAFDRGVAAYQREDYAKAATELGKSFELEADLETLYAWAQAERMQEDCDAASKLYRKLLGYDLPDENKEVIREKLEECRKILDEPEEPDDPVEVIEGDSDGWPVGKRRERERDEVDESERPARPGTPWYTDKLGGALVGSGLIAATAGVVFLMQAASASEEAQLDYDAFAAANARAESRGLMGSTALIFGGGLILGGVARYLLRDDGSRAAAPATEETALIPWLTADGGGLATMGRF
jgi:tetratricopeptide (TPR) repeat protein